ncbi:MAG: YkgJ family cysteine cluster protein [Bacillota bacterium]|nr:YkgJ family cysteine cluster protein [Bacillota bacterium]MDW7684246.1 YkgJ family cysteine cluster protein [Bacillota bacterium]
MDKLQFDFTAIAESVAEKPEDMETYARQQMDQMCKLLHEMPTYTCPASCNRCCHGSILMSYLEYLNMITAIRKRGGIRELKELFAARLGTLEEEGKLLCPFVRDDKGAEHCAVYADRPLICRVFGTTASPCDEEINHPHFPEARFFRAYNALYYLEDGSFIGVPLTDELALYEAPFDIWAIADSGRTDELLALFAEHGSMRAVICDVPQNRFFIILPGGGRQYLESIES